MSTMTSPWRRHDVTNKSRGVDLTSRWIPGWSKNRVEDVKTFLCQFYKYKDKYSAKQPSDTFLLLI